MVLSTNRMRLLGVPTVFGLMLIAANVAGQSREVTPATQAAQARPAYAFTVGGGNVMGGFGGSVERFFLNGSTSLMVGGGYVWEVEDGDPTTGAFAVAARRYLGGGSHQAVLELSASLLRLDWVPTPDDTLDVDRHYGPGFSLGYRYTASGGFNFTASTGAGWAVGDGSLAPLGSLAIGYTWRR